MDVPRAEFTQDFAVSDRYIGRRSTLIAIVAIVDANLITIKSLQLLRCVLNLMPR